jgi:hypothetical protein
MRVKAVLLLILRLLLLPVLPTGEPDSIASQNSCLPLATLPYKLIYAGEHAALCHD